jgi:hypothetical protein
MDGTMGETASHQATRMEEIDTYPPSWFNRLQDYVNRLPLPSWLTYLLLGFGLLVIGTLIQWITDPKQLPILNAIIYLMIAQAIYYTIFLDHIDKQAIIAFRASSPIMNLEKDNYQALQLRLTKLPSKTLFIINLITILAATLLLISSPNAEGSANLNFTPDPVGYFILFVYDLLWMINVIFIAHTINQVKVVNHIYTKHIEINIFRQRELYAFSGLGARTAIGLVVPTLPWIWLDPGFGSLLIVIIFATLGAIAFFSPMIGVHRLLKTKKDQLEDESSIQIERAVVDLLSEAKNGNHDAISDREKVLSSLEKARETIDKISTWPWQADTLRRVVAALALPIALWLIQFFLGEWLTN